MKLDFFNPWRDLTTWSGITIQWQTAKKGDSVFITYLRDKDSKKPITLGNGRTAEDSQEAAKTNLKKIGPEGVKQAIESGQMVHPSRVDAPKKEIDWRDGSNHRYKAQRDIVDGGRPEKDSRLQLAPK